MIIDVASGTSKTRPFFVGSAGAVELLVASDCPVRLNFHHIGAQRRCSRRHGRAEGFDSDSDASLRFVRLRFGEAAFALWGCGKECVKLSKVCICNRFHRSPRRLDSLCACVCEAKEHESIQFVRRRFLSPGHVLVHHAWSGVLSRFVPRVQVCFFSSCGSLFVSCMNSAQEQANVLPGIRQPPVSCTGHAIDSGQLPCRTFPESTSSELR